ncbi:MAG TPA: response regulator [Aquabacterium sp.]|nr:response regulator [Aquabacterium sp.]
MATVLLVHEDGRMAERLKDLMVSRGHVLSWQPSARTGFDAVLSDSFDLVILGGTCTHLEGQSLASLIQATGHHGRLLALQPTDDINVVLDHVPTPQRTRQWDDLTFESLAGFDRLKAKFLTRLPTQIESMQSCWQQQDWSGLGRVAHALKGSAACYGFDQVSEAALRVEQLCAEVDRSQLEVALSALIQLASTSQGRQGVCHE